jgi:hypothetical protein
MLILSGPAAGAVVAAATKRMSDEIFQKREKGALMSKDTLRGLQDAMVDCKVAVASATLALHRCVRAAAVVVLQATDNRLTLSLLKEDSLLAPAGYRLLLSDRDPPENKDMTVELAFFEVRPGRFKVCQWSS